MGLTPTFPDTTFRGSELWSHHLLGDLPAEYRALLEHLNGVIAFGGGLHIRGVCEEPGWHSLTAMWSGECALHMLFDALLPSDVPFGQDCFGDQFVLRGETVYRLSGETGEIENLQLGFSKFLEACRTDPVDFLSLGPLARFLEEGGRLQPGHLLSVWPPYCSAESAQGVSLKAVPALERIHFLADFARQIRSLGDGDRVKSTNTKGSSES
jgi:hypothetical protein